MPSYTDDARVVMTLDAGGTSFRFRGTRGNLPVSDFITKPSNGDDLKSCLANIVKGFEEVKATCPAAPVAISFAFPGPSDYPGGIIGDLPNLPAFRGGVALKQMLEDKFNIPVYINNDGNLFAYGESIAGFLPYINDLLEKAGSRKRYKNLLGVTLGTGFGGGLACNEEMIVGDNSMAGEIHLVRNKLDRETNAEQGACIRAVRRAYGELAGVPLDQVPTPRAIQQIAFGELPGNRAAAIEAFRRLGEVAGDAMANVLTILDGLAVIGGGISNGWPLFLPALVAELNGTYERPDGGTSRRISSNVFNLEEPAQLKQFLVGEYREITVPGSDRKIKYDAMQRIGVGISRLGTSEAIAIGAYTFALQSLDAAQSSGLNPENWTSGG